MSKNKKPIFEKELGERTLSSEPLLTVKRAKEILNQFDDDLELVISKRTGPIFKEVHFPYEDNFELGGVSCFHDRDFLFIDIS